MHVCLKTYPPTQPNFDVGNFTLEHRGDLHGDGPEDNLETQLVQRVMIIHKNRWIPNVTFYPPPGGEKSHMLGRDICSEIIVYMIRAMVLVWMHVAVHLFDPRNPRCAGGKHCADVRIVSDHDSLEIVYGSLCFKTENENNIHLKSDRTS
jgi:hypothetical protein